MAEGNNQHGRSTGRVMLTAAGEDKPGIVAAVTRVLYEQGCNLEDSTMTRLEGEFAMILIVFVPEELVTKAGGAAEALRPHFDEVGKQFGLAIHLKNLSARTEEPTAARGESHIISLYGSDRPGLVYRVAELLARQAINITDVQTHRTQEMRGGTQPLYQLLLEVEIPGDVNVSGVNQRLQDLAQKMRVEITLRAMDPVEL
jgi:glycine cleavage system transcriptional repressor